MKILHVFPSFGLGGMEKIVCLLINRLDHGYEHEILSLNGNVDAMNWVSSGKARLIHFKRPPGNFRYMAALYQALKSRRPDLLMTYNWGGIDAVWLGRIAGISRVVHHEHGFGADEMHGTRLKRDVVRFVAYRLASRIIVVSSDLLRMMTARFWLSPERVVRIPNGIDSDQYRPDPEDRSGMRAILGICEQDFVIGFLGRLDPIKNFNLFLAVVDECLRRDEHVRILMVGDGPEKNRIQTFIEEKQLGHRFFLVGQAENVLPFLRVMDVLLLTSTREQAPLCLLEAMAVGVPVVASGVGEISNMVPLGQCGFIFGRDDKPEHVASLICSIKHSGMSKKMGATARDWVLRNYTEDIMVQGHQKIFNDLLLRNK